jgi:hypothetical protein
MATNAAKAAQHGDAGDLRNSQSGRADASENIGSIDQTQPVCTVEKSGREQFRISIRDFNRVAKVEIRVFELDGEGIWRPTPRAIVIPRTAIAGVISGLWTAGARL